MADRTPKVNTCGKLTSKYLTPCKTFGLKRIRTPNSDILKKVRVEKEPINVTADSSPLARNIHINSPSLSSSKSSFLDNDIYSTGCHDNRISSPLCRPRSNKISSKNLPKPVIKECDMTLDEQILTERVNYSEPCIASNVESKAISSIPEMNIAQCDTSPESKILAQIKRINDKMVRIEKLKHEAVYTKKHNLLELQESTDKWLLALKEISSALHSELQERGRHCTLLDILIDHNIPPDRVGFNEDSQEFD